MNSQTISVDTGYGFVYVTNVLMKNANETPAKSLYGGSMQIVIAKVELTGLEKTGRYLDRYKMEPELRAVPVTVSCLWLNDGASEDLAKAKDYAALHGWTAYAFGSEVKDARKEAERMALEAFTAAKV